MANITKILAMKMTTTMIEMMTTMVKMTPTTLKATMMTKMTTTILNIMKTIRDAYAGGGRGAAAPPALSKDLIIVVQKCL